VRDRGVQTYFEPEALPAPLMMPPPVQYLPLPLPPPMPPPPPELYDTPLPKRPISSAATQTVSVGVTSACQTDWHAAPTVVHRRVQTAPPPSSYPVGSQTYAIATVDGFAQTWSADGTSTMLTPVASKTTSATSTSTSMSDSPATATSTAGTQAHLSPMRKPAPAAAFAGATTSTTAASTSTGMMASSAGQAAAGPSTPVARPLVVHCATATQTGVDMPARTFDAACETQTLERRSAGSQTAQRMRDTQAHLLSAVSQEVGPAAAAMVPRALLWMDAEWRAALGGSPEEDRSLLPLLRAMEEEIARLHNYAAALSAQQAGAAAEEARG